MPKIISNEKYLVMLKNKNISVVPIEEYNGTNNKILHRCTCGNKWNVSPSNVLNFKKCGCDVGKCKNYDYIKKLNEKKITVRPLDNYKGSNKKILHKCICGNIWNVRPMTVIKGGTCGCNIRQYHNDSVYKDRKTILYYVKINDIYKIGVILHERYKNAKNAILNGRYGKGNLSDNNSIIIIDYKIFKDGKMAKKIEKKIIDDNKTYRYLGERFIINKDNSGGESECFNKDIYPSIKKYLGGE